MEVMALAVQGCGIAESQVVPVGGLTVLFGANSAGKTNVMRVVHGLLRRDLPSWEDDLSTVEEGEGQILFRCDVDRGLDRMFLDELVSRIRDAEEYVSFSPDQVPDLEIADYRDFRDLVEPELRLSSLPPADLERMISAIFDRPLLLDDGPTVTIVVDGDSLSTEELESCKRLAQSHGRLPEICREALDGGLPMVEVVGPGWHHGGRPELPVMFLNALPTVDESEVVEALLTAKDAVVGTRFHVRADQLRSSDLLEVAEQAEPPDDDSTITTKLFRFGLWDHESRLHAKSTFRVSPVLHELARLLSVRATSLLPAFASRQGSVVITLLPPTAWGSSGRLHLGFTETESGRTVEISALGSGVRRWATIAVWLATRDVAAAHWHKIDDEPVTIHQAAEAGKLDDVVSPTWPEQSAHLVLVDEPESNLHPGAVTDALRWLRDLATQSTGVIVATHHPAFLGLHPDDAALIQVSRRNGKTELVPVPDNDLRRLDGAARELGLSRGDLLQGTRFLLFVEGPHDQIVLEEMVGDQLGRAGVRCIPFHGTGNVMALVESELAKELGIPMGVLTDNFRDGASNEDRSVDRLLQEARVTGTEIHRFYIRRRDILEYLHPEVCRLQAPDFPGWDEAAEQWKAAGAPPTLKKYLTATYGLSLSRSSVRDLAYATLLHAGVPPAIQRVTDEVVARAIDPRASFAQASEATAGS